MRIAVTDCGREVKQSVYLDWLRSYHPEAEFVTVSYSNGRNSLERFDGLVLTGGEDVDPALSNAAPLELVEAVDRKRDDFEFELLRQSVVLSMPVLGICRGLQVTNTFLGGTLVADLPAAGYLPHTAAKDDPELRHAITVTAGSLLHSVAGAVTGEVNSYHHQSVLQPADLLTVSAVSPDGVPEALEWKEKQEKPFLLLVQWHPERMRERSNPFTSAVAAAFVTATEQYHQKK